MILATGNILVEKILRNHTKGYISKYLSVCRVNAPFKTYIFRLLGEEFPFDLCKAKSHQPTGILDLDEETLEEIERFAYADDMWSMPNEEI